MQSFRTCGVPVLSRSRLHELDRRPVGYLRHPDRPCDEGSALTRVCHRPCAPCRAAANAAQTLTPEHTHAALDPDPRHAGAELTGFSLPKACTQVRHSHEDTAPSPYHSPTAREATPGSARTCSSRPWEPACLFPPPCRRERKGKEHACMHRKSVNQAHLPKKGDYT